jgi:hypothetical protein
MQRMYIKCYGYAVFYCHQSETYDQNIYTIFTPSWEIMVILPV